MLPSVISALIVGPRKGIACACNPVGICQAAPGWLISGYTIFGIGFPPLHMFIEALPLLFAVYIIAFGDFILAETVVKAARMNEKMRSLSLSDKSHLISGIRNAVLSLIAPYTQLAGPLWAAVTVV